MNDTVQLELEGVRLKTGLKLLLDQLDLTYRVVPEDNLLIITDADGSADPFDQVLSELSAPPRPPRRPGRGRRHPRGAGARRGRGAKIRKPTIIEEMPAPGAEHNKEKAAARRTMPPATGARPRSRPGA